MTLEQQVVSLELAQKLKELGVKQESIFFYRGEDEEGKKLRGADTTLNYSAYPKDHNQYTNAISAFTAAELGEVLPEKLYHSTYGNFYNYYLTIQHEDGWRVWYESMSSADGSFFPDITADTEADARAKMMVYLLENSLIKS